MVDLEKDFAKVYLSYLFGIGLNEASGCSFENAAFGTDSDAVRLICDC